MDGLPAPNSLYLAPKVKAMSQEMEALMLRAIRADFIEKDGTAPWWASNAAWYGPGGIGRATKSAEYTAHFLAPLHAAFAAPSLALDALVCEGAYCGAVFQVHALHQGPWLGVQATGRRVALRFAVNA